MELKFPAWMERNGNVPNPNRSTSRNAVGRILPFDQSFRFPGKIVYLYTLDGAQRACDHIIRRANEQDVVLGFDMEWPVTYGSYGSGKTALIQICPHSSVCYLLHISRMKGCPPSLFRLLMHQNVIITGINISGDIKKLSSDFNVNLNKVLTNNVVELKSFANSVLSVKEMWGLAGLTEYLTGKVLEKPNHVRMSQWNNSYLTEEQLEYAAADAYASLRCYELLIAQYFEETGFE